MLKNDFTEQNCSVARALEAVGERWTLLIVRELLRRPSRFLELERNLKIAKNVLSKRLEKLQEVGIVETLPADKSRDWNIYKLTRKGLDLFPVVNALMAWGDRHGAPNGPPVIVQHRCGHEAGFNFVCEHCGDLVDATTVRAHVGPGWTGPPDDGVWPAC